MHQNIKKWVDSKDYHDTIRGNEQFGIMNTKTVMKALVCSVFTNRILARTRN